MTPMVLVNAALCLALFWSCFCRLVKANSLTYISLRIALIALGVSAGALGASPWVWGFEPTIPVILVLIGMVAVQAITSSLWRDGVPSSFQKRECSK